MLVHAHHDINIPALQNNIVDHIKEAFEKVTNDPKCRWETTTWKPSESTGFNIVEYIEKNYGPIGNTMEEKVQWIKDNVKYVNKGDKS
jgi:hypothetical protein